MEHRSSVQVNDRYFYLQSIMTPWNGQDEIPIVRIRIKIQILICAKATHTHALTRNHPHHSSGCIRFTGY